MNKKLVISTWGAIIIGFISCVYTLQNSYYLVNTDYFKSATFSYEVENFIQAFNLFTYELPVLKTPLADIEVSEEEVIAAKLSVQEGITSYEENLYLEPFIQEDEDGLHNGYTLTDEEWVEFAKYQNYTQNQQELEHLDYEFYEFNFTNFYYELTDSSGQVYTNLTDDSYPTGAGHNISNYIRQASTSNFSLDSTEDESSVLSIQGTVYVPHKSVKSMSHIMTQHDAYIVRVALSYTSLIVALISILFLVLNRKKIKISALYHLPFIYQAKEKFNQLPLEIRAILFVVALFEVLGHPFYSPYHDIYIYNLFDLIAPICSFIAFLIALLFLVTQGFSIYDFIKSPELLKTQWESGIYHANIERLQHHKLYRNLIVHMVIYTIIMIGLTLVSFMFANLLGLIGLLILILIFAAILNKIAVNAQQIVTMIHQMARGEKPDELIINRPGLLQAVAHDLNTITAGVTLTEKKQSQSERLKTELITNVSHDLRTPLTSILNYVDLARREDITEEERQQYLQVLDQKSKRLKVLIDDLFEASKMASGAVDLQKEKINLVSLLTQSLDEYEERFESSQLMVRTNVSHKNMMATVDARKLFRVFENLFSNVCKYSQPNTRVYIELVEFDDQIRFSIKNISKYELGFDLKELEERFKRGDASRHTDGSGLGLSIVKSILDLHQATLSLEQEADLFKVTIILPKA